MPYGGDPANSTSDQLRLLIHDTSTGSPLLTDAEVSWFLDSYPSVWFAAAAAADTVAASKASDVLSKQVGDLRIRYGVQSANEAWTMLAAELRREAARRGVSVYAGGISKSDKATQVADTDWDNPGIGLGMHDA